MVQVPYGTTTMTVLLNCTGTLSRCWMALLSCPQTFVLDAIVFHAGGSDIIDQRTNTPVPFSLLETLKDFIVRCDMKKAVLIVIMLMLGAAPALGLEVGDRAPDFRVDSTHGMVELGDYAGTKHVVLAFYFKDFTSG